MSGCLDVMMIGQHFYENSDGSYSFSNIDKSREFEGLSKAIVEGIKTGLFSVVAHPDRCFRRCKKWSEEVASAGDDIISTAKEHEVYLEKNYSSMRRRGQYWKQFWEHATENKQMEGYDAHSVAEMVEIWKRYHITE